MRDMDTLLRGLPYGEAQYSKDHYGGYWNVHLFEEGTTLRIMTLAQGMDKNVACFFADAVNKALKKLHQGRNTNAA